MATTRTPQSNIEIIFSDWLDAIRRSDMDTLAARLAPDVTHRGVRPENPLGPATLNGVLIPAGQSERHIFLTAAQWTPDSSRKIHAVASAADGQASAPSTLHVRRGDAVAGAQK